MLFTLGLIVGFLFWKIFGGQYEGHRLEKSFRPLIKGYYVHIHHWIWCSILIFIFFIFKFTDPFILGVLLGSVIQGLTYGDRFIVVYKKSRFHEIYSRFKRYKRVTELRSQSS